ncbi:MAG TPA: hypothetical protein VMG10_09595 [Gemmataceae bacterium]|nr:hypothetical protein [Gemmataceae bacterium]
MLSSMVEAGSYAAQQAMSYLSGYESTVSTLEQIVVNREQQNLLTIFRVESSVEERIEQFIQQALFPTATASSPNSQSSSMGSGPPQVEQANSANLNDSSASEPTAMPVGQAVPIGETSPAGGTIPPAGSFSPSQII